MGVCEAAELNVGGCLHEHALKGGTHVIELGTLGWMLTPALPHYLIAGKKEQCNNFMDLL